MIKMLQGGADSDWFFARDADMRIIRIGNRQIAIKDYYCSENGEYLSKEDGKLWLYVNLTDVCPAACPFCVNPGRKSGETGFNLSVFKDTLRHIKSYVYGISFTGGEPMMEPELLDHAIEVAAEIMGRDIEIDMVTNGINLNMIPSISSIARLDSIHLSRHRINDEENRKLMGFDAPEISDIQKVLLKLNDPAQVVLNCVLAKKGVCSIEMIADYLEMAAGIGVSNSSFIAMIPANKYCKEEYINPATLDFRTDPRFRIWNHFYDHEYCSCSSGDYIARNGCVRFYYRMPGCKRAPFARQLVYTSDNHLLKGFGQKQLW